MSKKLLCVVMAIIFMVSTVVSVSVSADMQPMTEYSTDDEFSSDVEESTEEDVSDFVNEKWDNYGVLSYHLRSDGTVEITGCNQDVNSVEIPSEIEGYPVISISDWAFGYNDSLECITIGKSVKNIGYSAFEGCTHVKKIVWKAKDADCDIRSFAGVGSETDGVDLILEDTVEYYDCPIWYDGMYYSHINLKSVKLGKNIKAISRYSFYNADYLDEIVLPDSIKTIGEYAFFDCDNLKNIEIPESVSKIDSCAFYNCSSLHTIIVPDSVKHIGYKMIDDKDTQTVYYKGSKAQWDKITFGSESQPWEIKNAVVHYNAGDQKHEQIVLPALEATCTETGLTEGFGCSGCEMFFKEQTVIPAKGHIDEDADNICDVCDEVLSTQTPDADDGGESGDNNSSGGISSFFASIKELFNRIISWFRTIFGMV